MAKYRKKPVVIDAVRWTGKWGDVVKFFREHGDPFYTTTGPDGGPVRHPYFKLGEATTDRDRELLIYERNHEAWIKCKMGYWIIRGTHGEFYPCDPKAFEDTYEPVEVESNVS